MRRIGPLVAPYAVPCLFTLTLTFAFFVSPAVAASDDVVQQSGSGFSAFVYVGDSSFGSGNLSGFAIAADGSAQPVPGSPYSGASFSAAANGNHVFATDGQNIVTYTRAGDGSLSETSYVDGRAYDLDRQSSAVAGVSVTPDGHDLYTNELYFDGANNAYLAWKADASGRLSYVASPGLPTYSTAGSFPFAYSADSHFVYTWTPCNRDGSVWGFARRNNGTLRRMNVGAPPPPPQQGQGGSDCSQAIAASRTGFVAVGWNGDFCCGGPPVIAVYAIQSDGTLALVPGSEQYISCDVSPMAFDPSGRLLAVACNGVQVYSLSSQGRLTPVGSAQQRSVSFGQLAWDNANHLYGIPEGNWQACQVGGDACGLYVFNSSGGTLSLAQGSPHRVAQPGSLAVTGAQ